MAMTLVGDSDEASRLLLPWKPGSMEREKDLERLEAAFWNCGTAFELFEGLRLWEISMVDSDRYPLVN